MQGTPNYCAHTICRTAEPCRYEQQPGQCDCGEFHNVCTNVVREDDDSWQCYEFDDVSDVIGRL